jgi:hypothetical protein
LRLNQKREGAVTTTATWLHTSRGCLLASPLADYWPAEYVVRSAPPPHPLPAPPPLSPPPAPLFNLHPSPFEGYLIVNGRPLCRAQNLSPRLNSPLRILGGLTHRNLPRSRPPRVRRALAAHPPLESPRGGGHVRSLPRSFCEADPGGGRDHGLVPSSGRPAAVTADPSEVWRRFAAAAERHRRFALTWSRWRWHCPFGRKESGQDVSSGMRFTREMRENSCAF